MNDSNTNKAINDIEAATTANDRADDADISNTQHSSSKNSKRRGGMESSVLKFSNVNFTVGKGDKKKYLLENVNATVHWGHVLAIMGPSGAGKTTLISALTLDATYGTSTGSVTLNGVPMTDAMFQQHCYVVKQHDAHWPYLTCRETLSYAAQLYHTDSQELDARVDEILRKMGLEICAHTRNSSLSGGQRRRLSIGLALLKQPTVLFLDEPTSGLDAASASNIMQEIVRVAKEERLIIVCTIHQPSTKVFNSFDQLMILSRGRPAFVGNVNDMVPYFTSIGHECPANTNPAEFILDLINSDFSEEKEVTAILDAWEEFKTESSHHATAIPENIEGQEGIVKVKRTPLATEIGIMFRRHFQIIVRDPILYIGRCVIFLFMCLVFALVYLKARDDSQDQVLNKFWIIVWFLGVPTQMGVVGVFSLNEEFKSILRESKNGMVSPLSYVLSKTILVLPIFFIFGLFSLGIPFYAVQGSPGESFAMVMVLYACVMFVFESVAEALSVWCDDPILGMLQYMNYWFGAFLFGGFLIPLRDLYYPFELFYHVMPFSYYLRSTVYQVFKETTFEACVDQGDYAVCVDSTDGLDVLDGLSRVMPLFSTEDKTGSDLVILIVIGLVYKLFYIAGVAYKTRRSSKFQSP